MLVRNLRRRRLTAAAARAVAGVLLTATLVSACRTSKEAHLDIRTTLSPASPAIGPATLAVTVHDRAGKPVTGAKVRLEGHMSHAGMSPVFADAVESNGTPGAYTIAFTFTMEGDWVLLVAAVLPDGRRTEHRVDVRGVRASR